MAELGTLPVDLIVSDGGARSREAEKASRSSASYLRAGRVWLLGDIAAVDDERRVRQIADLERGVDLPS